MDRSLKFGLFAMVAALLAFVAMNYLSCPDECQVALVAIHLLAAAIGAGVGSSLVWRRRWLGLVVLAPCLGFLGLQVSWLFQCCH